MAAHPSSRVTIIVVYENVPLLTHVLQQTKVTTLIVNKMM